MKKVLVPFLALSLLGLPPAVRADFVYVTACVSNCTTSILECGEINTDLNINYQRIYDETYGPAIGLTTAIAVAPGKPPTLGARYFGTSFYNTAATNWLEGFPPLGVTISPTLGVTGGVYRLYHVYSSAASNVSTNVVLGVTNTAGCTLSFTNTDKFQRAYGTIVGGMNPWQFLGFVTNDVDTSTPSLTFYYESGVVDAGAQQRLLIDTFLFVSDSCTEVAQVGISGAYKVGDTNVVVTGVNAAATAIKVYQYASGTWTLVGQRTTGIVAGTNNVAVSDLVKGGQLQATQTIGGQEGCIWGIPTGVVVGEPNPRLRLALSLRDTPSTVVGERGVFGAANIHFLGVTNRISAAPGYPGKIIYPSNSVWQTVTFHRGPDYTNPIDPSIKWNRGDGDPVGTINGLANDYYMIDAIAFAIDDLTSTGPHDIYIDTIQNGSVVFYGFEAAPAGSVDFGFRAPGFSGTTSGLLAGSPNSSVVVNNAAYEGTKAMRIQWAWNSTANTRWLRLTPNGVGDPVVDVREPITIRFLYVPDGGTMPPPPPRPTLSATQVGGQAVLNWVGGHRLQTAVDVTGVYTNIPRVLSPNAYTNITLGAFLAPWTNTFTEPTRFFRLVD